MKEVVTFGEILLELAAGGAERFVQARGLEVRFTGPEARVAAALANFGVETHFVSKLPSHGIAQAALNSLRQFGVRTEQVLRGGDRLGLRYLEAGSSFRPSTRIDDRRHSSLADVRPDEFDWETILAGKHWFHFSRDVAALGENVRQVLTEGVRTANQLGLKVSCDCGGPRPASVGDGADHAIAALMDCVDVLICGRDDPERIFGIRAKREGMSSESYYQRVAELLREKFEFEVVALTLRETVSPGTAQWGGLLCDASGLAFSEQYELPAGEASGTDEAFAAGLIYGMLSAFEPQHAIEFAAAAACLKHSVPGNFALLTVEEINRLLERGSEGGV